MTRGAWTPEQIARLIARYPHMPTVDLAADLGRSVRSVYEKANGMGIKKTAEFLASGRAGRLDGVRGMPTRFKPGHLTWNKGMKSLDIGGAATRFRPGQMPHNTLEVGAYRITRDGTLQRKIGTAKGSNSKRWRGVHELVWVEAHGPVPTGHIVVFKPGTRTTELAEITLDKVECISLAENMRRNTVHNLPKPIADLVQLRGALNRKINRIRKETDEQRDHC